MTKSTITRERLQEIAEDGFLKHGESKELARMALAAMDSEPVAWTWQHLKQWHVTNDEARARDLAWDGVKVEPLYRHAQLAPEYPEVLPCPVLLEPGLRFGKGIKTSTMLAALARRAVYESDMSAISPEERAEFQARIEDFKALIAQPVPVVPDEMYWQDAPVDGSTRAAAYATGWNACRAAMLAAAPQSPGSEPATVPGKWIPVSERMPEVGDIVLTAMGGAVNVGEMECSAANCRFFTSVISGRELPATHWMPLPAGPKEDINALIPLVSRNEQEGK